MFYTKLYFPFRRFPTNYLVIAFIQTKAAGLTVTCCFSLTGTFLHNYNVHIMDLHLSSFLPNFYADSAGCQLALENYGFPVLTITFTSIKIF